MHVADAYGEANSLYTGHKNWTGAMRARVWRSTRSRPPAIKFMPTTHLRLDVKTRRGVESLIYSCGMGSRQSGYDTVSLESKSILSIRTYSLHFGPGAYSAHELEEVSSEELGTLDHFSHPSFSFSAVRA